MVCSGVSATVLANVDNTSGFTQGMCFYERFTNCSPALNLARGDMKKSKSLSLNWQPSAIDEVGHLYIDL